MRSSERVKRPSSHASKSVLAADPPWPKLALLWLAFAAVALVIYGPALGGSFTSDDEHYVERNPYVHDFLEPANFVAIWDPTSVVTIIVENYAPVHLVLHGLAWQAFGESVTGHHVVNVLLHALASVLLFVLFARSGIPPLAALIGASIFLVHPANVESVAWISQLKSSAALVLTLAAVLAHPRRPLVAVVSFAFALLAKPFAAVAFFAVLLFGWIRTSRSGAEAPAEGEDWRWRWMLGWVVVLIGFAVVESLAFSATAAQAPTLYDAPWTRVCMMLVAALRYLVMAATGTGLSVFHEPKPISSLLDPEVLASIAVLALVAARLYLVARARREETVYWVWALISFGPLSGIVPLPYPIADRYLYFILPGLIGAVLLALQDLAHRISGREGSRVDPPTLARAGLAIGSAFVLLFAFQAHARAPVWINADEMMADSERNYPDGAAANTRKASRAAAQGDFAAAVKWLEAAHARGYNRLDHILIDPNYGPMQGYEPFVELRRVMAQEWVDRLQAKATNSQVEARGLAQAYIVLGDLESALRVIEGAIAIPGPITSDLESDAEKLRDEIARRGRFKALEARKRAAHEGP